MNTGEGLEPVSFGDPTCWDGVLAHQLAAELPERMGPHVAQGFCATA